MRIGSLEITAALLAVAVVAARPRVRAAAEIGRIVPVRVTIEVMEGRTPRTIEGIAPLEIGRAGDADVVLRDPEVSRRHARIDSSNGVLYVDDLSSSNGTFVNGRRIVAPTRVAEGDTVDAGTTRMILREVRPVESIGEVAWT